MVDYARIKARAKGKGKSLKYLAKCIGKGERYFTDAKNQHTKIPDENLVVIARELDTSVEWLKGETENPSADQNSIENLTDRTIGNLSSPEDAGELLEALIPFIPKNELLRLAQMLMAEYQKRDQG